MTYLKTRQKELIESLTEIADKLCESYGDCTVCPFNGYASCPFVQAHAVQNDISDMEEEPTYEDLPIDLDDEPKCADGCIYGWNSRECKTCDYKDDDYRCDSCGHPYQNDCFKKSDDDCPYGLGECCEDNLATNVGRICFDHNLPTNFAMAIIEIIQKERDRNEYLHLYREHFPAE